MQLEILETELLPSGKHSFHLICVSFTSCFNQNEQHSYKIPSDLLDFPAETNQMSPYFVRIRLSDSMLINICSFVFPYLFLHRFDVDVEWKHG